MTSEEKDAVAQAAYDRYRGWYGEEHMGNGSCLYWAQVGCVELWKRGVRALPQAGSMSWPILMPGDPEDDGVRPTHLSYEWGEGGVDSQLAIGMGALPEVHVWIGIPGTGEIVDFSTRWLRLAAERLGLEWRTPEPPNYVWCRGEDLPAGVVYQPKLDAIFAMMARIGKMRGK